MATFNTSQQLLSTNLVGLKSTASVVKDIQTIIADLESVIYSNGFDEAPVSSSSTEVYTNPHYTGVFGTYSLLGSSTIKFNPKTFDVTSQISSFKNATIATDSGNVTVTGTFSYKDDAKGIETTKLSISNISFLGTDNVTKWSATTNISYTDTYNYNTDKDKVSYVEKYTAFSTTDSQGNSISLAANLAYDSKTESVTGSVTGMTLKLGNTSISATGLKLTFNDVSALNFTTVGALLPTLLAGADKITGGADNDTINGFLGNDTLAGGAGSDTFVFSTALGKTNVDTINGYSASEDTIQLDHAVFNNLPVGALSADNFNSYIRYDAKTGKLYYDADGSGKGAAVQFATLVKAVGTIDASEFVVV